MMVSKSLSVPVDKEIISCAVISKEASTRLPRFVYFHGGGTGTKEGVSFVEETVIDTGSNILTLDFSGHGKSTGELKKGSLKKRVNEAEAVIDGYGSKKPLIICGVSMGGFIAMKMLEKLNVDTLILFCPALYDERAYDVRFDEGFTEIIRQPESWKNTDVLKTLQDFTGKLLVIMGEEDEVIPEGVITLIKENTPNTIKQEFYTIPGCPHKIHEWILGNDKERKRLFEKLIEYLDVIGED